MVMSMKARQDLVDASVLLVKLRPGLDHDENRLEDMASDLVSRAIERVELCHNELDCKREGI